VKAFTIRSLFERERSMGLCVKSGEKGRAGAANSQPHGSAITILSAVGTDLRTALHIVKMKVIVDSV
jgi:hypothetical protein